MAAGDAHEALELSHQVTPALAIAPGCQPKSRHASGGRQPQLTLHGAG